MSLCFLKCRRVFLNVVKFSEMLLCFDPQGHCNFYIKQLLLYFGDISDDSLRRSFTHFSEVKSVCWIWRGVFVQDLHAKKFRIRVRKCSCMRPLNLWSSSVTCPSTSAQAPGTLSFPRIQLWIASADWFHSICQQSKLVFHHLSYIAPGFKWASQSLPVRDFTKRLEQKFI